MFNRRYCTLLWVALAAFTSACNAAPPLPDITVNEGKHRDYYHLSYKLNKDNFTFSTDEAGMSYANYSTQQLIGNGGQFELLIHRQAFPVRAPECRSRIILRMPWTNPDSADSARSINEKIRLFDKLKRISDDGDESIKVIIELNPYVKIIRQSPLTVELTQCNVFFRHSRGRYIDHL